MMGCAKVIIGKPIHGKVYVGAPLCPESVVPDGYTLVAGVRGRGLGYVQLGTFNEAAGCLEIEMSGVSMNKPYVFGSYASGGMHTNTITRDEFFVAINANGSEVRTYLPTQGRYTFRYEGKDGTFKTYVDGELAKEGERMGGSSLPFFAFGSYLGNGECTIHGIRFYDADGTLTEEWFPVTNAEGTAGLVTADGTFKTAEGLQAVS